MESSDSSSNLRHRRTCPVGIEEQVKAANEDMEQSAFITTGILQIICGSSLVIMGGVSLFLGSLYRSGFFIWGALFFPIATGIVGIKSQDLKRKTIRIYTLMSLTSSLFALLLVLYDVIALILQQQHCDMDYHDYYAEYATYECHHNTYVVALHGCSAVAAFIEMIIGIAGASCGCCGCCCIDKDINIEAIQAEIRADMKAEQQDTIEEGSTAEDGSCWCCLMKPKETLRHHHSA